MHHSRGGVRGAVTVLALLVALAAPARADNYFTETHYDLGVQSLQGLAFGGETASGIGLHLTEHNGILSRAPYAIIFGAMAGSMGGDEKLVVSNTEGSESYDVVGVDSQGVERSRETKTRKTSNLSVTVVPRTAEEIAARDAALDAAGAGLAVLAMQPSHFELMYLPNRDDGHLRGVRGAWYGLALGIGRHVEIAFGYAGARLKVDVEDPDTGMTRTVIHRSRAIAARLGVAPARWVVLTAELHINVLHYTRDDDNADYGSTARGTAALSIPRLERFYGKLGAERIGLGSGGRWSTFFEAGMRF